jgi:hypothetical protein
MIEACRFHNRARRPQRCCLRALLDSSTYGPYHNRHPYVRTLPKRKADPTLSHVRFCIGRKTARQDRRRGGIPDGIVLDYLGTRFKRRAGLAERTRSSTTQTPALGAIAQGLYHTRTADDCARITGEIIQFMNKLVDFSRGSEAFC